MRPDLVCVGDVMLDVAVAADALRTGGDVGGEVRIRPGGAAANAAVWGASTGAAVRLHARVGNDLAGRLVEEAIRERGVQARLAADLRAPTGTMLVVHQAGERSMVADRGANADLSADDLPERLEGGAVLVSGYTLLHPGSRAAGLAALERARAGVVAVDAASWPLLQEHGPTRFLDAAATATLLLANELEAAALTGLKDPEDAARKLASACGAAVVKRGRHGALLVRGDVLVRAAASPLEEVDPTGAGDAFDGVLLASLARGSPDQEALRSACLAGARCAGSVDRWPG